MHLCHASRANSQCRRFMTLGGIGRRVVRMGTAHGPCTSCAWHHHVMTSWHGQAAVPGPLWPTSSAACPQGSKRHLAASVAAQCSAPRRCWQCGNSCCMAESIDTRRARKQEAAYNGCQ